MDVLCTPRRGRRMSEPLERRVCPERRKSLFGVSGVSPLSSPEACARSESPLRTLSPSWSSDSPAKSPRKAATPVKTPVKSLQNDFTQMVLTRTPEHRIGIVSTRRSPRILGVRRLSPDRGVITPKTFYGKSALSQSDGKVLYQSIRESVRIRLPMETLPKEKKRARSGESGTKRPKKLPRYRLFEEDIKPLKKRDTHALFSEKKTKEKKLEKKDRPSYNWQFFNTKTPPTSKVSRLFADRSPSVLTPPPTAKKRKLLSSYDLDHLAPGEDSPRKKGPTNASLDIAQAIASDFTDDEDEDIPEKEKDVDQIIQDLNKDVAEALGEDALQDINDTEDGCTPLPVENKSDGNLFPVFRKNHDGTKCSSLNQNSSPSNALKIRRPRGDDKNQLLLDCGQSNLREVECTECNFFYVLGDASDEALHANHHLATTALTITNLKPYKIVRIVGFDTVIRVKSGDSKTCWQKARSVLEVVDTELGYPEEQNAPNQVYMYVKKKKIIGCVTTKSISYAHRLLPDLGVEAELCTEETFPVRVGISRIWVHSAYRRQGIASHLLDTLRRNYTYGEFLKMDDIAFSAPTEDGKRFARNYCQRDDYLIYM